MTHELSFDGDGKTKAFVIEITEEDLKNCGSSELFKRYTEV